MSNQKEPPQPSKKLAAASLFLGVASLSCPFVVAALGAPSVIQGQPGKAAVTWLIGLGVCGSVIGACLHTRLRTRNDPARFTGAGFSVAGMVFGILSALLVLALAPLSFSLRREVDRQVKVGACAENLMATGRALQGYAIDHGAYPESLAALRGILRRPERLWCAGDTNRTPANSWEGTTADNISFELLRPGGSEGEHQTNTVLRCPIHGLEWMGNGKLRHSQPWPGTSRKAKGGQ